MVWVSRDDSAMSWMNRDELKDRRTTNDTTQHDAARHDMKARKRHLNKEFLGLFSWMMGFYENTGRIFGLLQKLIP